MTTATHPAPVTHAAHRSPAVYWWLTSLGLSLVADQIAFIALSWATVQVAEPTQVGLVLATGSVPRLVLLLFGGALSDWLGAKPLAVASASGRTLVLAATAVALLVTAPSLPLLVAVAGCFGVLDALLLPAVGALPPRLVAADQLARLQGMRSTVQRACLVAGAPLAGVLVARLGLAAAFGTTVLLVAGSLATLAATRLRPAPPPAGAHRAGQPAVPHPRRLWTEVVDGMHYVRRHRLLPALLLVTAVAEFGFTGPVNTGLPLLAAARGWGSGGVGWLLGGFGLGATTTALLLAVLGHLPQAGLLISISAATMGLAVAGIGMAPTLPAATGAATVLGLGSGVCGTLTGALLLAASNPEHLGRVMSVSSVATFGGIPLSYSLAGLLAGRYGTGTAFVTGGLIAVVAAAAGATCRPLRLAVLPEHSDPPSPESTPDRSP